MGADAAQWIGKQRLMKRKRITIKVIICYSNMERKRMLKSVFETKREVLFVSSLETLRDSGRFKRH